MSLHDFDVCNSASNDDSSPGEALIKRVQKARKVRATFFGENLFADPAWDILLELYASELRQQRVSITSASDAAGVPATTALRWMAVLEEKSLVSRNNDPFDGRRVWISLTAHGASLMHRYFTATWVTSLTT
jgi:DNA-binding MarR family transcriptional regulator